MDMEDCIVYLVWQLRQSGFEVRFTWPNLLFISWRHHESAYLSNQNPIVQAMVPDRPPMALGAQGKKKKPIQAPSQMQRDLGPLGLGPLNTRDTGTRDQRPVAFNQEIELITQSAPANFGRRAVDYEPPASFIQNLDRPGPGREKAKGNVLADLWTLN